MEVKKPRYQSITEIPVHLRKLKGVPLSLSQIEQIMTDSESSQEPFSAALNTAQKLFAETHSVTNNQWVTDGSKK